MQEAEVLISGGEYRTRSGRRPVVVTKCEFQLPQEDLWPKCRDALLQFHAILLRRSDGETLHEWADVRRAGTKVMLSIFWYDKDFFERRNKAYMVGAHPLVFQRFGLHSSDLSISHFHLDESRNASDEAYEGVQQ